MELRTGDIKPLSAAEPWINQEQSRNNANTQAIPPVPKALGGLARKVGSEGQGERQDSSRRNGSKAGNSPEEVQSMLNDIEDYLGELKVNMNFKVEDKSGELVVQVLNSETGDVIRQIPPDNVLKLRDKLKELRGVLFEETV